MSKGDQSKGDELDLQVLQAENEALKKELDEVSRQLLEKQEEAPENLKELAARAQADLQNAKERLEKEADEMRKFAAVDMLIKLLPTIDNLNRAFENLPENLAGHDWVKGVQAVEQELMSTLEGEGLIKIEALGAKVDPLKHEVLQTGPGEEGTITEVFEDGYELHEKVLRVAKVKVGDGS